MQSFEESHTDAGRVSAAGVPVSLVVSLAVPSRRLVVRLILMLLALPALAVADETLRQRLEQLRAEDDPKVASVRLASAPVLDDFYRERGFTLERLTTNRGGVGCNQYLFRRPRDPAP